MNIAYAPQRISTNLIDRHRAPNVTSFPFLFANVIMKAFFFTLYNASQCAQGPTAPAVRFPYLNRSGIANSALLSITVSSCRQRIEIDRWQKDLDFPKELQPIGNLPRRKCCSNHHHCPQHHSNCHNQASLVLWSLLLD